MTENLKIGVPVHLLRAADLDPSVGSGRRRACVKFWSESLPGSHLNKLHDADLDVAVEREEVVDLASQVGIMIGDASPSDGARGHSAPSPDASVAHKTIRDRAARRHRVDPSA